MKKIIILTLVIITGFISNKTYSQVYTTGWDTPTDKAGWVEYELGTVSGNDWAFEPNVPISAPNSLVHYYPVGGTTTTDDWFVSPAFDFSNGGTIDSFSYLFAGFGTPQPADTIAIYLLTGNQNPSMATASTLLKIYQGADYQNDNTWRKQNSITIPPTPGTSYFAFRYKTIINWLDVKLDNLGITANFNTGITDNEFLKNNISIHPNPTSGKLNIATANNIQISTVTIYNILGSLIQTVKTTNSNIDISYLDKGQYFISIETNKGILNKAIIKL